MIQYGQKNEWMVQMIRLTAFLLALFAEAVLAQSFNTGLDEYQRGHYEIAFNIWKPMAEHGFAPAQSNLGWMYDNGYGITEDDVQAVEWYLKAAKQSDESAQANLGWMYANGFGIEKDDFEAVHWYRGAAGQGDATAQYNLGWMYENGRGTLKSESKAVSWYVKASRQGLATAQDAVKRIARKKNNVLPKDSELMEEINLLASEELASNQADPGTESNSQTRNTVIISLPQQPNLNKSGQQVLSAQPNSIQSEEVGKVAINLSNNGTEVGSTTEEPAEVIEVLDMTDPDVQYKVGWQHMTGKGTAIDYVQAYKWFILSSAQGNKDAEVNKTMLHNIMSSTQIAKAERLSASFRAQ